MPNDIVISFAKKTGKSTAEVEKLWNQAKASAKTQRPESDPTFYRLVTGILKRMLKINESKLESFKEFNNNIQE